VKTRIVRIGNSQGIRIPKLLLAESGLEGEVEIEVRGGELVVRAAGAPRAGAAPGEVRETGGSWSGAGDSLAALRDSLERFATGAASEEVILDRAGRPVAKLVPIQAAPRRPGRLKGRLAIRDDFDAPLPEALAAAFRGKGA
jgi:antitoxin (DNA-binding transcriptional repressor) of toxin-antitoxin stability system